jgi:proteasome accessory factor B
VGIEPVVRTTEEAFEPLRRAVRDRRAVGFGYRKREQESETRRVQPWGLGQWHGRWYLTGHDLVRGAARVFRIGRIDTAVTVTGPVGAYEIPEDHDPRQMVEMTQTSSAPPRTATLRVRPGAGNALRRRARTSPGGDDGWVCVEVDFQDVDSLAGEVAGYGPDVVALEPADLREAVVRLLEGAALLRDLGHTDRGVR